MRYLAVVVITFLISISHKKTFVAPAILRADRPDTSKYFILQYTRSINQIYFKEDVTKATLSKNELKLIDSILKDAVLKHNNDLKKSKNKFSQVNFKIRQLSKYYKQIIAVTNQNGEKIILLNCLCSRDDINRLKKELIIVEDGGNCYFNLKINLTQKTSYDLYVNGIA